MRAEQRRRFNSKNRTQYTASVKQKNAFELADLDGALRKERNTQSHADAAAVPTVTINLCDDRINEITPAGL